MAPSSMTGHTALREQNIKYHGQITYIKHIGENIACLACQKEKRKRKKEGKKERKKKKL